MVYVTNKPLRYRYPESVKISITQHSQKSPAVFHTLDLLFYLHT